MITFNQYLDSLNEGFNLEEGFEALFNSACQSAMIGIPMNKIAIQLKAWVIYETDADEWQVDDFVRRIMDRVRTERRCIPNAALPPHINSPGPGVN